MAPAKGFAGRMRRCLFHRMAPELTFFHSRGVSSRILPKVSPNRSFAESNRSLFGMVPSRRFCGAHPSAGANEKAEPISWPRREGLLRRQNPAGIALFHCSRRASAKGSGERKIRFGRRAETRSGQEGTGACFGKQKALLSGPDIGLLTFSSTNLDINPSVFMPEVGF
jgi:hypothetical protein